MTKKITAGILGIVVIGLASFAWADEGQVEVRPYTKEQAVLQHILDKTGCRHSNCKRLIEGSDDEGARRNRWQGKMMSLKKTHPEKYRQVKRKIRGMRQSWLRQLKTQDPAKYEQVMEQRRVRMQVRLAELKKTDPNRYQKIMAFKEKLAHLEELKEKDPKAYKEFIRQHPGLKDHESGRRRHGRYKEE